MYVLAAECIFFTARFVCDDGRDESNPAGKPKLHGGVAELGVCACTAARSAGEYDDGLQGCIGAPGLQHLAIFWRVGTPS
jgi:hypothetical protein